jgi:hypothetical protein
MIFNVFQFKLLVLLTLRMKVNAGHASFNLVEAYVIEALEACA